jgi:Zn-dependent metalloprotease
MLFSRLWAIGIFGGLAGAAALPAPPATAQQAPPAPQLSVRVSRATGLAASLTSPAGGPIPLAGQRPGAAASPEAFLAQYGALFGIRDTARELVLQRRHADRLRFTHSTYRQVHRGLPVFTGVIKVHQDPAGAIIAANGDFYPIPDKLVLQPALGPAQAAAIARAQVAAPAAAAEIIDLVIADPGWYGDLPLGPRLAYHIVVADLAVAVREAMLVDAHTGLVLDRWTVLHTARVREVYDAMEASVVGSLVREEGDPPTGDDEVDAAYDYAGDAYGYYDRAFDRDGIDGDGMTMILTTHYGADVCPNAFWTGSQMVFCTGVLTDDVTGHELTHGVTQFTAGLIYQNQSGQLNEAFSDIFGELIDLYNGNASAAGPPGGAPWPAHPTGPGDDTPNSARSACSPPPAYPDGVRWMLGEDAAAFGGAVRDMWNPTCAGDPDRANSDLQTCALGDNGGVHSGSGVANHAFAIMVDGKEFNGRTVSGIGTIKAGAVWYRALTVYLTPNSDFQDADWALNRAAADLVGTTPKDPRTGQSSGSAFTAANAEQVAEALAAVEMNTPGRCGQIPELLSSVPPPECSRPVEIFAEDFEDGLAGWSATVTGGPATPYNWVVTSAGATLPFAHPGRAAFCADPQDDCPADESAIHRLESPAIDLPERVSFPTLAFTHTIDSEASWDGGNVRLRVDNGPWELLPASAYYYNGYNRWLAPADQGNTNPLAGEPAFSGGGGRWGTSLVALGGLVKGGQTVRLRFEFGKDSCAGSVGWFIDDVHVYDCLGATDCDGDGIPDEADPGGDSSSVLHYPTDHSNLLPADADGFAPTVWAQHFGLLLPENIAQVRLWGAYLFSNTPAADNFTVIFHEGGQLPGRALHTRSSVTASRAASGFDAGGFDEYEITLQMNPPVLLEPGEYWVEIFNDTSEDADDFAWVASGFAATQIGSAVAEEAPGEDWTPAPFNLAVQLIALPVGNDCDGDGIADGCPVDLEFSAASAPLSPIGANSPQQFTLPGAPWAESDVELRVEAVADLNTSGERLDILLNDTLLGQLFGSGGHDCPREPDVETLLVAPQVYNDALAGGDAVIDVRASASVDAEQCDPPSSVTVSVNYERVNPDCDASGLPDACELAEQVQAGSPQLSPLAGGTSLFFVLDPAPPAGSDVLLRLSAAGDLNAASEYVDVLLNGSLVGSAFTYNAGDCPQEPAVQSLVVPAAAFNSLLGGGVAEFELRPASGVSGSQCAGGGWIKLNVHYAGHGRDCDANGRLDSCDIAAGATDCDADGRPDACQLAALYEVQSPAFTPVGGGLTHVYRVLAAPEAAGDVTLSVVARADLGSVSEKLQIVLDGSVLGEVFAGGGEECPRKPDLAEITVSAAEFNAARADGEVHIAVAPSDAVELTCPDSHMQIGLSYAVAPADCDTNGGLDACQIAKAPGLDCNANGALDACELAQGPELDCDSNGALDVCDVAQNPAGDCDGSGALDACELAQDPGLDCDANGVLDACELAQDPGLDCDANGALDACELAKSPKLDCNRNGRLDSCDIDDGDSPDRNGNGIPDECEDLTQLLASVPPDGAVDARQPANAQGTAQGWEEVLLTFSADVSGLGPDDFEVQSSGTAPDIAGVDARGPVLTLLFDDPIPAGECTSIVYLATSQRVRLGFLPGDANSDGTSGPLDILALIDSLNGTLDPPLHDWQCDINRSGACEPLDILKLIDLLNGAGPLEAWNGRTLPHCP